MASILELDGVSKAFGGVEAVCDLTFSVSEGEVLGLIGPNGAGKTTLFSLISGFMKPDKGRIRFEGEDIAGLKAHRMVAKGIARTFQIARPLHHMSVAENVLAGAMFGRLQSYGRERTLAEAGRLLNLVSLFDKSGVPAGTLTLAEQRRLELARALATMPRLLMLDEVMAGLTPDERDEMAELILLAVRERGLTAVISEHAVEPMMGLCDKLMVLDRGRKLAEGDPRTVLSSEAVEEVYLGRRRG